MPPVRPPRRRTPTGVTRRRTTAILAVGLALAAAACSNRRDDPTPRRLVISTSTVPQSPTSNDGSATAPLTFSGPSASSALLDYPHLFAAMAVVPQKSAAVSFTDLDLIKKRLGYADVTSESPTSERFDFWERARADGAMFTGTRLYDASSVMSLDYGWTGEDVAWEVDFTVTEEGCRRSMLCEPGHGYALGLRADLDWSVVTNSRQHNGFEQDGSDPETFRSDDPKAPFDIIHLIPELHAVAGGNEIGVKRLADVVEGAPPYAPKIGAVYDRLETVESLQVSTGCVDLSSALGPDSTSDDVTAFVEKNVISELAPAVSTVVSVADRRRASIEVELGAGATEEDVATRIAAMRSWPGLHSGRAFADVADATGSLHDAYESFAVDVSDMATLRAMVLTDEAPWALCPFTEPR